VVRHPGHEIDVSFQWTFPNRWQPDPVEADPLKGSRNQRKVDILGMIVGIIGSKDQLVHEYRTMLAEKLLNKSDYDIDSEIRTLELLKVLIQINFMSLLCLTEMLIFYHFLCVGILDFDIRI
jgi:hypothetical protein